MRWYLIHTKPRQEKLARENLERQGYTCYLPLLPTEKFLRGKLTISAEPLFPRYLFIRLDHGGTAKSWSPIRSTKGVSRLVTFGTKPAIVSDALIDVLKSLEAAKQQPQPLFLPGERVRLTSGAFTGVEGIYQMSDGENRAMVLIEVLSRPVQMQVAPGNLSKTS
ncbi:MULTISPECIES: transcription/translation regulatory transformer protein RfaH [unclassified Herbaspirillum]|jgi:transcriptional antiterminator RfaH|uniref:transcription/translation regulatory transformer protein RfaH n=1 Tax=unclassified Herbaspirillum TaxID=2624150 RepID=UPI000E2E6002|nr:MULTISPECIES: transcription/translation regulatory transformer protein RfaH [unclassified Herbaspirillum]RFB67116.1 transcription/translation regulatory transformer protein RfaH [Herbaspirillum sp. 3R-3a1]TFI06156.1 transcription/translation regulatory transformer protein RfaH [Herbaspirillum sp. 3R11]TFI14231.1 transcription/translation regulatory transformer protein RfaH [Herbaspirillum sp. 3R-11]TFI28878.1 transcription/translation regulatory transformer protein RfaH [Herbaspirillum sp. 3